MSKAQDSKKETKKPAAKTAKEKQEAKKAKKAVEAPSAAAIHLVDEQRRKILKDAAVRLRDLLEDFRKNLWVHTAAILLGFCAREFLKRA